MLSGEVQSSVAAAIEALPPTQRQVIIMRDVQGWSATEVCNVLALSESEMPLCRTPWSVGMRPVASVARFG